MKSFKQFLRESKKGTPVKVEHGSHAKKKKPKSEQHARGTPVKIEHGSHSNRPEPVKEDSDFKTALKTKWEFLDRHHRDNSHYGNDGHHDGVHKILHSDYHGTRPNPHSDAIDRYSEESFDLNHGLYMNHAEGEDLDPDHAEHAEALDRAIRHKKLNMPLTVFSGVKFNPGMKAAQHEKGRIFVPGYTSTSINPRVANQFTAPLHRGTHNKSGSEALSGGKDFDTHIMKIALPAGHHGHYLGDRSQFPEEREFLLPRGMSYKIHPKPEIHEVGNNFGGTHRMHVWKATPVSDED